MDEEKIRTGVAHVEFILYSTSRILDRRVRFLDWRRKVVTFLEVFVPLMTGCAVLSFGLEAPFLPLYITTAGVTGIMQLGFLLWSLVSGWDRSYSDYMVPVEENTAVYNLAGGVREKIGKLDEAKLEALIDDLTEGSERGEQEDSTLCVSDKEFRYANRISCFHFKGKYHICNVVPLALKPGKCVCDGYGRFQQGEYMSSARILDAYFEASGGDRKEFLRVLSHFYRDDRGVPLQENMEGLAANESIRKSQSINFTPMRGGCPLCSK